MTKLSIPLHLLLTTWFLLFLQIQSTAMAAAVPVSRNISCIPRERDALLAFKANLVDVANYLSPWQGEDSCQWNGIRCSNRTGHVMELCLSFTDVRFRDGQMSSSLLGLKNLRTLYLSSGTFTGTPIPEFIGGFKNLRYLSISSGMFGGRVPPHLGNLSKLLHLDLNMFSEDSYIYSTDLAWLSRLTKLQYLDLSKVNLSKVIDWAHVVNKLPSLVTLSLAGCGLRNAIPSPLHINLTSLEYLELARNEFSSSSLGQKNLFWDLPSLLHLDMSECGLQGSIPQDIGNMTSITRFDLSVNNLTGTIPTSFNNLHNLEELWLSENSINGPIAVLLETLPAENRLQELQLFENKLTGNLPSQLEHLRNLTTLDLSKNLLSGELPTGISALRKLTDLSLDSNNLEGTITETHFTEMASLTRLILSGNSLSMVFQHGWIPPFKLVDAQLQSCVLGPSFPEWLRSQNNMHVLDISDTSIVGPIPHWFWVTFSGTEHLVLSRNEISGKLSPTMFRKMEAETMDFSDNCLVGPIPKLPNGLKSLDLSRNNFSGKLPSDLGAPLLTVLMLYNNSISGKIPHYFCDLENLVLVDLSENKLHGPFPNCVEQQKAGSLPIAMLNLNTNYLSGNFPTFLLNCKELIFLDLSYNQFSGILPTWIGDRLPSLSFLSLRSNYFSGHIPQQVSKMKQLQYLDLACNNISGIIPESLAELIAMAVPPQEDDSLSDMVDYGLSIDDIDVVSYTDSSLVVMKGQQLQFTSGIKYMVNIDFSCNSLTGHIPEEIGRLPALKNLNLSWNHLSGIIPDSIGEVHSLESLDLSHNNFFGEIPASISDLTSLIYLNLSYNNLTGRIPAGNQLRTLTDQASIYIGNLGLCGPPLSKNCSVPGLNPANLEGDKDGGDTVFLFLATGCGYVMGLWMVFCLLLFKKNWRVVCFLFADRLYDWVYLKVALSRAFQKWKKVESAGSKAPGGS